MNKPLRLYFVIGEVSGDTLGADLIGGFAKLNRKVEPFGLGGPKMHALGLQSLFDVNEIAVMGLSGIVAKLPTLIQRVRAVVKDVIDKKPDAVILIDSPEFAKQIAIRVKRKMPNVPIIKYVCPSVWAWRENRAKKMNAYLDHVLAILPFEPELLKQLGGPDATYVGHPLARLAGKIKAKDKRTPANPATVLLMPGSRKGEIHRMLPIIEKTVDLLAERGTTARYILPAVSHLAEELKMKTSSWKQNISIVEGEAAKQKAFDSADLAIATSGTAILELAMHMVPCISIYKLDPALNAIRFIIKAWTAALPNLIADKVIVPERINQFAHPEYIARLAEALMVAGPERDAQLNGFELVHQRMKQKKQPAVIAARIILDLTKT